MNHLNDRQIFFVFLIFVLILMLIIMKFISKKAGLKRHIDVDMGLFIRES